jgi:Tfp pilus assembly protein PilF
MKEKDYENAEKCFLKALDLDKKEADPLNNLGVLFLEKGDMTRAREYFLKVKSDPLYPFPQYAEINLGIISRKEKDYVTAEKHFKKALTLDKKNCNALKEHAILEEELGNYEKAIGDYKLSIQFCPNFIESIYRIAVRHLALKQEKEGKEYLSTCMMLREKNQDATDVPFLSECVSLAKSFDIHNRVNAPDQKKEIEGVR